MINKMLIFLIFSNIIFAKNVFETKHIGQADLKVFVTNQKSQADLFVSISKYNSNKIRIWKFEKSFTYNSEKIYFVKYKSQADIIIYIIKGHQHV